MKTDLENIRRLLEAGTKGPWRISLGKGRTRIEGFLEGKSRVEFPCILIADSELMRKEDEDLIVALVNAAPDLISELEALRVSAEAGKKLREAMEVHRDDYNIGYPIGLALAAYDEEVRPKE